jgi:hypothetical protein
MQRAVFGGLPWHWAIAAGAGAAALCATAGVLSVVAGPPVAIALGAIAAWEAGQQSDTTLERDAAAGATVGLGILAGAVAGLALADYAFGAGGGQTGTGPPRDSIASLAAELGASAGLVLGAGGLVLSTLAGWLYGLAVGHGRTATGRPVG